jgi:hypothetical protein
MIGSSQSAVLTQKESTEKIIRFIKEKAFKALKNRSHIYLIEFYEKSGSQEKYYKVEISFKKKGSHTWSPKECIVPINESVKMIIEENKDCYICFDWKNNNKNTLFMIIKLANI